MRDPRGAERVKAPVDVDDLAADRAREIGEEEQRRVGDRARVGAIPAEGRGVRPGGGEPLKAGDPGGGGRRERSGGDQVDAHAAGAEVAGQIARDGLQGRLGDAHPVVRGPGDRGVEVEADDAGASRTRAVGGAHQRFERPGERLQRVGAGLERGARARARGADEVAAESIGRRVRDRVHRPVDVAPTVAELALELGQIIVLVDVELEHLGLAGQPLRGALRHPAHSPEAGQNQLGALLERPLGDRVGDRVVVDDTGHHQPLALDDHSSTASA